MGKRLFREIPSMMRAFLVFLRACPIDDFSQVPYPGRQGVKGNVPCTHGLSAVRLKLPKHIPDDHKKIVTAAAMLIDQRGWFNEIG